MAVMQNPNIASSGLLGRSNVSNIIDGAQLGIGAHLPYLDGAMPATFGPVVLVVTHVARILELIPNGPAMCKALLERHPTSVDGIDFGYNLENQTTLIGHDKQELAIPTSSTRTPITPSFTFKEINGNLVWNFFRTWIWLIRDPDTQMSGAASLSGSADIDISLLSSFACDLCWIQFDATGKPENILDGGFITGLWPSETGLFGLKREIGAVEVPDRTIPMHGIMQHNDRTREAAMNIAEVLAYHTVNYNQATPLTTEIESSLTSEGVQRELADIASEFSAATSSSLPA